MKAKLIPVMIERYVPSKKSFQWVEGYKVISPEGDELQPYMRKISTRNEISASQFCKNNGWKYEIVKTNALELCFNKK